MKRVTNKEAMEPVVKAFMAYIDYCGLEKAKGLLSELEKIMDEMQEVPFQ